MKLLVNLGVFFTVTSRISFPKLQPRVTKQNLNKFCCSGLLYVLTQKGAPQIFKILLQIGGINIFVLLCVISIMHFQTKQSFSGGKIPLLVELKATQNRIEKMTLLLLIGMCMEYDRHIFLKYIGLQMKNIIF